MDAGRAIGILSSEELSPICDMIAYRDRDHLMVRAHDGAVRFRAVSDEAGGWDYEVDGLEGRSPVGVQDPTLFPSQADELSGLWPAAAANAYPMAYETLWQIFEHTDAPDIAAVHSAAHNWEDQGGHIGEHGSLDVVQSRAPLILSGQGVAHLGRVRRHSRLVDVAPTVMAWLGYPTRPGIRLDGSTGPVRLDRQDGQPGADLLEGEPPRHVVAFLMDGTNPNLMHAMIDAGRLPHLAALAANGTDFGLGALASFPTVTLANHTTILTGAHPGHHGIIHNAFYRRATAEQVITNDTMSWPFTEQWLSKDVQTIHEAIATYEPDAFTASCNEPTDRGAGYSTFALIRNGQMPPFQIDAMPPHGTERFVRPFKDYRWASRADHSSVLQAQKIWDDGLRPRFHWVNFSVTDAASHRGGPHSEMAEAALEETDARIGDVLAAIDRAGRLDGCGFLVVADHGMEETNPEVTGEWSRPLRDAGVEHRDEAYGFIYLSR